MTSRTKMGLLNTKTNDYLKSYLEFSQKSKESQKFFAEGNVTAKQKIEGIDKFEMIDKFTKTYEEQGRLNSAKLNWLKLNKDTNMLTQESSEPKQSFLWKKGKTDSLSGLKKSKKKISHKQMKSSIPIGTHKREMSLDRFRDELNKFKSNQNQEEIQISTARPRGHQKTKSDLSLAYANRMDGQAVGMQQTKNYLQLNKLNAGEIDFEAIRQNVNKMEDQSMKDVRKMQFDSIYNTKFSNLKKELKIFSNTQKIGEVNTYEQNLNLKKARNMLTKTNKSKYSSFTESTFQKLTQKVNSTLFDRKLLNKSKIQGMPESSRIRHKYTKSEPQLLLGLKFQKAVKNDPVADSDQFELYVRKESQPIQSYRSSKRSSGSKYTKSNDYKGSIGHIFQNKI